MKILRTPFSLIVGSCILLVAIAGTDSKASSIYRITVAITGRHDFHHDRVYHCRRVAR